jgi:hypothetical protein
MRVARVLMSMVSAAIVLFATACGGSADNPADPGTDASPSATATAAVATGPLPASILDTWQLDCGDGRAIFKLVISADHSATFDWLSFHEDGTTSTDQFGLRVDGSGAEFIGTVVKAPPDAGSAGGRVTISMVDTNTVKLVDPADGSGMGVGGATLKRQAIKATQDCPKGE